MFWKLQLRLLHVLPMVEHVPAGISNGVRLYLSEAVPQGTLWLQLWRCILLPEPTSFQHVQQGQGLVGHTRSKAA